MLLDDLLSKYRNEISIKMTRMMSYKTKLLMITGTFCKIKHIGIKDEVLTTTSLAQGMTYLYLQLFTNKFKFYAIQYTY